MISIASLRQQRRSDAHATPVPLVAGSAPVLPARTLIVDLHALPPAAGMSKRDAVSYRAALRVELEHAESLLAERPHDTRTGLPTHECRTIIARKNAVVAALQQCNARIKELSIAEDEQKASLRAQIAARVGDPVLHDPILIINQLISVVERFRRAGATLEEGDAGCLDRASKWVKRHVEVEGE
jgi:hypothetical protein